MDYLNFETSLTLRLPTSGRIHVHGHRGRLQRRLEIDGLGRLHGLVRELRVTRALGVQIYLLCAHHHMSNKKWIKHLIPRCI